MKNLLINRHVVAGVLTALFTGAMWIVLMRRFGHMSLEDISIWSIPLIAAWAAIGLSIGLVGRRNGSTPLRVSVGTLLGTGSSPIAILPLMGFVVLPLGKLAEWMGLFDRAALSKDAATTLAIIAMITIWLFLGIAIGVMSLFVSIRKPGQSMLQTSASEHRL